IFKNPIKKGLMPTYDFTTIVNRLNDLENFMNSVITLSKKIFELPANTPGGMLIAIWNSVSLQTEQYDLGAALSGVFSVTNGIIALGTISRSVDTFTFSVGFQWRINGTVYNNAETDI